MMTRKKWLLIGLYGKIISVFFMVNVFLDVINEKLLHYWIPVEIVAYLFWLSLGLFLGFQLCQYLVFKKEKE